MWAKEAQGHNLEVKRSHMMDIFTVSKSEYLVSAKPLAGL